MLYVYIENRPEKMITDVDGVFKIFANRDMKDPVALKLMEAIDGAVYASGDCIRTPFGTTSLNNLSSGCKAALLAIWSGVAVNLTLAGDNDYEALLKYAKDRDMHVWTHNRLMVDSGEIVCVDGKKMTTRDFGVETVMQSILRDGT